MRDDLVWRRKLDPYSRMQLEDGLPEAGADVVIRLAFGAGAAESLPDEAGLKLLSRSGQIVTAHIDRPEGLERLARLDCVESIQLSRPLYLERPSEPPGDFG